LSLESSSRDLQIKLSEVEANVAATQAQLAEVTEARAVATAEIEKLRKNVKEKDEDLERMNIMVVELKTEATIAKAELEGAYGSRAQRAAEVAALTKSSEKSELSSEVDKLKSELASILRELEDMTKETITAEKEKLELESKLDDVLAAKTGLESEVNSLRDRLEREVSRLQEQLDAERLKVPPSPGSLASQPRAGASMLSEQFRATMKEERRKFQEEIRVRLPT
jgi:chromosome segregation ATPase